ncbi:MAG: hypothetical protein RR090_12065 [Niameybacter sp.]
MSLFYVEVFWTNRRATFEQHKKLIPSMLPLIAIDRLRIGCLCVAKSHK